MALRFSARPLAVLGVLLFVASLPATTSAQVIKVFNNSNPAWTNASSWTPSGSPGTADTAQFGTLGTATGSLNQPILNSAESITQLGFSNTALGSNWTLTGAGSLSAGSATVSGLSVRGVGTSTINLGDGTATSLTLTGVTGTQLNGAFNIGHGATVMLTGNTVAALTGTSSISLRGGGLILDNSAGNPTSERLTGSGAINIHGGGASLEFRSAAGGTNFTGLTGTLTLGGGDASIRVNQTGAGPLNITLGSLFRSQLASTINFQNVGAGTLGGGGASDPTLTFTTAPGLTNGVIALGTGSGALGFALYNGTDFASYDATNGVIPVASTPVSGALSSAASQNIRITGNATIGASNVSFNTVKLLPSAAGQSLVSSGGNLNTVGLLLAGSIDYTITGGGGISGSAGRYLHVVDPNTTLFLGTNLGSSQATTKAGEGFLVLTGTTNQFVGGGSSAPFYLTGGTFRVTTTNFNLNVGNAPNIRFRGGVIEYDVSGNSATLNNSVGTGQGSFNWYSSATGVNNLGSGGFSAFSSNPANTLTVNLSSGTTLTWGGTTGIDVSFVQDGHALKFGSTKSNATVNWQNPVNLDSGGDVHEVREIRVTRGVGNAEDRTRFNGVLAGSATTDLLKTGTGVLELTAANTYAGNTQINNGTLLVTGSITPNTGSSNVFVHPAGTLGGTGTLGSAGNNVHVFAAGTLAPGASPGSLTVHGNVTMTSTATYAVELGGATVGNYDQTVVNGSVALNNAALTVTLVNGYTPTGSDLLFVIVNDASDSISGTFNNVPQDGTITFGGYAAQVSYTGDSGSNATSGGNDVVLYNILSVPELGTCALLGLGALLVGSLRQLRRRPALPASTDDTPVT
jgi:autotransporter-associated beta strand protein